MRAKLGSRIFVTPRSVSRWRIVAASVALLAVSPAKASQTLGPFPISIENHTSVALACYALAGHWYGFDLGTVSGGDIMRVPLSLRPADRTLSLQNSLGKPVPIQMIYCGDAGNAYDTRTVLDLQSLVARGQHVMLCTRAGNLPVCH
jgi:hypothetical protein